MNSFDLVVTSMLLNKQVPLFEGLLAFALLIVLQFIITWLSVRADVGEAGDRSSLAGLVPSVAANPSQAG